MNKYQEALNDMYAVLTYNKYWHERKSLLQELVDKATPMKPNFHYDHSCGNCGSQRIKDFNDFVNEKYCSNCGQAILWEE